MSDLALGNAHQALDDAEATAAYWRQRAEHLWAALDELCAQAFKMAAEEHISVLIHPNFHIALDAANRLAKREMR